MKPVTSTSTSTSLTTPISSKSILWNGPSISCLDICLNETIEGVISKLAATVCEIYDKTSYNVSELTYTGTVDNSIDVVQKTIDAIVELQNATPEEVAPVEILVPVNACISNDVELELIDFLALFQQVYCDAVAQLQDNIDDNNTSVLSSISSLDGRVTALENAGQVQTTIEVNTGCASGGGGLLPIDEAFENLEGVLCGLINYIGDIEDANKVLSSQCTDLYTSDALSTTGTMGALGVTNNAANVSESVSNIWVTLCDLREAYKAKVIALESDIADLQANAITLQEDITYTALTTLIGTSSLEVGKKYRITDFATVHYLQNENGTLSATIITGTTEPLTVTALSANKLELVAYSDTYPSDIIHYDVEGNSDGYDHAVYSAGSPSSRITGFKGLITYRKDTIQNNSTYYDFRAVKFTRSAIQVNTFGTYTSNTKNNSIGKMFVNTLAGTTFNTRLNNVVFLGDGTATACHDNSVRDFCYNITIGNLSYDNSIGNYNYELVFGQAMYNNTIGDYNNNITAGTTFAGNILGKYSVDLTIGNSFIHNTIEMLSTSTIGNGGEHNTFLNHNYSIIAGTGLRANTFHGLCNISTDYDVIFGNDVQNNIFEPGCFGTLVADLDLTASSHLDQLYNCNVLLNNLGVSKLRYFDDVTLTVVAVTA